MDAQPQLKIRRDGLGAFVNWTFLAGFAYAVWQCAVVKYTLEHHQEAITRIEKKLDAVLDPIHNSYP